jgi:hypothetical protein
MASRLLRAEDGRVFLGGFLREVERLCDGHGGMGHFACGQVQLMRPMCAWFSEKKEKVTMAVSAVLALNAWDLVVSLDSSIRLPIFTI